MFTCVSAVPSDGSFSLAAKTLRNIVADFDGHPVVKYLWVDECDVTQRVHILAALYDDAPVNVYGFRDDDALDVHDGVVRVRRGRRTWPLATTVLQGGRPVVAGHTNAQRVTDAISIAGHLCVPNAPSLSCDVGSRMTHSGWYTTTDYKA